MNKVSEMSQVSEGEHSRPGCSLQQVHIITDQSTPMLCLLAAKHQVYLPRAFSRKKKNLHP